MPFTKIVATMGPACNTPETLRVLIEAGVDVVRINCSHGQIEDHVAEVAMVRQVAEELGRHVAVVADLQGPKMRVGELPKEGVALQPGDSMVVRSGCTEAPLPVIPCVYEHLAQDVRPGDRILFADGMIEARVEAVEGHDVTATVVRPGILHGRKGINLPGVAITAQSPTPKDLSDLEYMVAAEVDYVALSFVQTAADVNKLRDAITALGATTAIIAKLERPEAVLHLDEIVDAVDAIMVARGDLGVEAGPEQVPILQKRFIAAANAHAIPVITATEMLESMITETRPTRAEASDIANAVFDGTDAVMLSAETAVGAHPVESVRYMRRICDTAESAPWASRLRPVPHGVIGTARAVARAVYQAVIDLNAVAVVVHTTTGASSRLVSSFRPGVPILALSPSEATIRRTALHHGVQGAMVASADDSVVLMAQANEMALSSGLAKDGDTIIVVAGAPGQIGGTNRMLVHHIDSSLPAADS
ncbi:MAG: pyruvate kinase [Frankiaceae bacterium]|nr:pyruvate kinase [Frankiaceae bacterium]